MKRILLIPLIISLVFLSSCKKEGLTAEEKAQEIEIKMKSASEFSLTMELTADYEISIFNYGMTYIGSANIGKAEVTFPEEVKGLKISFSSSGTEASYDGSSLYMGELSDDGLSPVEFIPAMIKSWQDGYILSSVYEPFDSRDTILIETGVSENSKLFTWYDLETDLPVKAEIASGGRVVISCVFTDIQIK